MLRRSIEPSVYTSLAFSARLATLELDQSFSAVGSCYDNAAVESFFATLKAELIGDDRYPDAAAAHDEVFGFIEGFYNTRRLHSALGYCTPAHAQGATL